MNIYMYIYIYNNNIENAFIYFKVYLFYNLGNLLHVTICMLKYVLILVRS